MIKAILVIAAVTGNYITYPGLNHPEKMIEMTTDKGLILEIVLRCGRKANGQISPGIMSYSKIERLYCSSRNNCYTSAKKAVNETCNFE